MTDETFQFLAYEYPPDGREARVVWERNEKIMRDEGWGEGQISFWRTADPERTAQYIIIAAPPHVMARARALDYGTGVEWLVPDYVRESLMSLRLRRMVEKSAEYAMSGEEVPDSTVTSRVRHGEPGAWVNRLGQTKPFLDQDGI